MTKLDSQWAIEEIDKFLHVTAQVRPERKPGSRTVHLGKVMRGSRTEASERAHVVEKILDRVLPGWQRDRPISDLDHRWLRDQASRCRVA